MIAASVLAVAFVGLRVQGMGVARGWLTVSVTRKSSHMLLGTLILASWPFYRPGASARWFAALPVFVILLYFLAVGSGLIRDERMVEAASRSGTHREVLFGPSLYCVSVVALTVLFWGSPVSVAAFAFLIFGDGLGEVVGDSVDSFELPWNRGKSAAGSLAVLVGGWLGCVATFWIFDSVGFLRLSPGEAWMPLVVVAAAGAFAESATSGVFDNVTVPVACVLSASVVF